MALVRDETVGVRFDVATDAPPVVADDRAVRPIGWTLIGLGVGVCGLVLAVVALALYDPTAIPLVDLFEHTVGSGSSLLDVRTSTHTVRVGGTRAFALLVSIMAVGSLATAAAIIARGLIVGGARLLAEPMHPREEWGRDR